MSFVNLPDSVIEISEFSFSECENLISLALSDNITTIGENAFAACPNLTLTVGRDSYAKQYCIENNLKYTYPDANDWLND